jgi:glycerophosphoryl diester phosphodiesterase
MAGLDWLTARPIAHRGYHDAAKGRIENTLSAVRAAVDRGFAIECDLQVTADGEAIAFHDDMLDRLTDAHGAVGDRVLAELKGVRLRGTEDRIPTLGELLETVGGRAPLVIELKSRWNGDRRLERAVAPILTGYRGRAAAMSFDPASMRAMRRLAPDLPRGLVADHFDDGPNWGHLSALRRFALRNLLAAASVAPAFVSYGIHALPAPAPLLLHRLGLPLITWTIRTEAQRAKARRYADQITFEGFDPDAVMDMASAGSA